MSLTHWCSLSPSLGRKEPGASPTVRNLYILVNSSSVIYSPENLQLLLFIPMPRIVSSLFPDFAFHFCFFLSYSTSFISRGRGVF
jgi:hypothetical protein